MKDMAIPVLALNDNDWRLLKYLLILSDGEFRLFARMTLAVEASVITEITQLACITMLLGSRIAPRKVSLIMLFRVDQLFEYCTLIT